MTAILSFRVSGYRAISEAVQLNKLGSYVALYGDNAVGKSSVLHALDLLGRMCQVHPNELIGSGRPWPALGFFERFHQDPSIFNDRSVGVIELEAKTDGGLHVGFRLTRRDDGLEVACTHAKQENHDLRAQFVAARDNVTHLTDASRDAREDEQFASISRRLEQAQADLVVAEEELRTALAPVAVSFGTSPSLPISRTLRESLFDALASGDASRRTRLRNGFQRLAAAFPALGVGAIDVLVGAAGAKDLAWVTEHTTLSIEHLGGGIQSAVATMSALYLAGAPVVCLEEPEAFVGTAALDGLRKEIKRVVQHSVCDQVWIATHAIQLVAAEDPIVVLDRQDGVVRARQGPAVTVGGRFSVPPLLPLADDHGRLGQDGSIRLPPIIIERKGLSPGDFVYFTTTENGIQILTGEELDATLPEDDTL
ncbi:hypothetical protein [Archangium sp.]|uniref:hypothetical protein n=1 Tax=Archangium sp. TaxID=1872627 RepID=UPI00286BA5E2|nr:hypothetical protein [Archangium sp.]